MDTPEVLCLSCKEKTKYQCVKCRKSVCNRPDCSTMVSDTTEGYSEDDPKRVSKCFSCNSGVKKKQSAISSFLITSSSKKTSSSAVCNINKASSTLKRKSENKSMATGAKLKLIDFPLCSRSQIVPQRDIVSSNSAVKEDNTDPQTPIVNTDHHKNIDLSLYGDNKNVQQTTLRSLIEEKCKKALKSQNINIHNYYTCGNECKDISLKDKEEMTKHKNFKHQWLFDSTIALCPETGIWSLCYVDGLGMFCALCQFHDSAHPTSLSKVWNNLPNVRYRPSTIRGHFNKSKEVKENMHSISVEREKLKTNSYFVKEDRRREKILNVTYKKVFHSLYWLCKEEIAVSKSVSLFDLVSTLGVKEINEFKTRSPTIIRNMIISLSDIIKENLISKIKMSEGYACLTDEVTDIANMQNLLIFLRYYDKEAGKTATSFVSTNDLLAESETTTADAQSIFASIKNCLVDDLNLDIHELIGFCSDGASVMTGKRNGVAAKFKELGECKSMINVHCICHRLALACGDTGDDLKFIEDFETTMIQLWAFFKNSPKRLKIYIKTAMQLKEFENLPEKQKKSLIQTVKKAVRTRWLSLDAGVEAVYKEYTYLIHAIRTLKDQGGSSGATAMGVLKRIDNIKFLCILYVLKFVLPHLSLLSKTFQTGELNFSRISPAIEKTIFKINEISDTNKPLKELKFDLLNRHSLCEKTFTAADEEYLKKITERYANSIIQSINERFPDDSISVLNAFGIFNVEQFPADVTSQEFKFYGTSEIGILQKHFNFNDEIKEQWTNFKFEMKDIQRKWFEFKQNVERNNMKLKATSTEWALKYIARSYRKEIQFSHIFQCAKSAIIVPVTNAWPERGASAVKRIKNRMRSTMKIDLLNALMMISLNGPMCNSVEAESIIEEATERYDTTKRHHRPKQTKSLECTRKELSNIGVQTCDNNIDIEDETADIITNIEKEILAEKPLQTNLNASEDEDDDDD